MLLVIDSATAACSVALIDGDQLLDERHEIVGRGHAERLVPMIEQMIRKRRPRSLLVDCGPGSFTGVRVGLAAAHGLAIGWRAPLSGYSSTALIAAGAAAAMPVGDGDGDMAVALHGGHGQLFVQSYGRDPVIARDELRSLVPAEAAASISAYHVFGSGAELLVSARGFGEAHDAVPRAAEALLMPPELRALLPRPIYGRPPDASPAQ